MPPFANRTREEADHQEEIRRHNELTGAPEVFGRYHDRHVDCHLDVYRYSTSIKRQKLNLAALATSRQVHKEAALLPYKLNTFAFYFPRCIYPFLRALVQAQARAIEDITVHATEYRVSTLQKVARVRLDGLKRLMCVVEMGVYQTILNDAVAQSIMQLKGADAITGTVLPYFAMAERTDVVPQISRETIRKFAKRVEDDLLAPSG